MKQKFGIFLALALMLAFAGCQFDSSGITGNTPEAGYGLLKLSINGSSARTIMPPDLSGDDATYTITFDPQENQGSPTGNFVDLALNDIDGLEVELELGDWDITVTAFSGGAAIAEDTKPVTITDTAQNLDFTLDPFAAGEGKFTWTLTADAGVTVSVAVDGSVVTGGEETLNVGNYIVTVTLTRGSDSVRIEYALQIYNNLTSEFIEDFTGYKFASDKLNPPVGAAWPYDDEEEITFAEDITLNSEFPLSTGSLGGVDGTFSWKEDGDVAINANEGGNPLEAIMVFEPADTINYNPAEKTIEITVLKAAITGSYAGGALTGDEGDMLDTVTITATTYGDFDGTYAWVDGDTTTLSVAVTSYNATFTPDAKYNANYNVEDKAVTITVNVTAGVLPINASTLSITVQAAASPTSGIVGDEITLTGTAVHDTPCDGVISYQWYKNYDDAAAGGTEISSPYPLTSADVVAGTVYFYFIATNTLADNDDGGIKIRTSDPSDTVAVSALPIHASELTITVQAAASPTSGSVGDAITLSGTAVKVDSECEGVISYQWYRNYSDSNANGTTISSPYTLTSADADAGTVYFYFVATNTLTDNGDGGDKIKTSDPSNTVAVDVSAAAAEKIIEITFVDIEDDITTVLDGGTFNIGDTITLDASDLGSEYTLTAWRYNGANIANEAGKASGANTLTLELETLFFGDRFNDYSITLWVSKDGRDYGKTIKITLGPQ